MHIEGYTNGELAKSSYVALFGPAADVCLWWVCGNKNRAEKKIKIVAAISTKFDT